jgi:hypothetical protein
MQRGRTLATGGILDGEHPKRFKIRPVKKHRKNIGAVTTGSRCGGGLSMEGKSHFITR